MDLVHQDTSNDKHAYHLGKQLTEDQQRKICHVMESYSDVLAVSFEEIKGTRVRYQHHIDTGDHKPIRQMAYRLPPHHKEWV